MRFVAPLILATALAWSCVRTQARPEPAVFSGDRPVSLRLRAPLDELFARADRDADSAVDGSLVYVDAQGRDAGRDEVRVSVRGNSSKQETECSFPKLKLRFASGSGSDGSLFEGLSGIKIGTHCGEEPGERLTRKFGRLANEKAPPREVFVYRLLRLVGVPALRARAARITYEDPSRSEPLVRNAMLLEETDDAQQRLGARREIPMERFGAADTELAVANTVDLTFAEAMIGNFDWCLRLTKGDTYRCDASKPLWNILVFEHDGDRRTPVMYDFDLAGMVTGRHIWFSRVLNQGFSATRSQAEVEVVSQLQHTRSLFARAELDAARRRFLGHRDEAFAALRQADVDSDGREIIQRYLTSFFDAIATDEAFYRPVVIEETKGYAEAEGDQPLCPQADIVPVGTPVGPVLARRGGRVQVRLLDALWHWTGRRNCDAIQQGTVWIDPHAVGTDYPR